MAGTGERLSGEASASITSVALLAHTVVDDTQGLFKKHREEELEERRKLYRLALPSIPTHPRNLTLPDPTGSADSSHHQCLISFFSVPQVG